MRIVTNQGSNLHPQLVAHYDLDILPQEISVDGEIHDTRDGIELERIEYWVQNAKHHPTVLGTSAAQLSRYFVEVAKEDRELLFIASSRKIIRTHDAALVAARTLQADKRYRDLDIRVVDTGMTDVGASIPILMACQALRAGEGLDRIEARVSDYCRRGCMAVYVSELESLIKGGRASFLQGWLASVLRVRPLLGFEEGELHAVGRIPVREDEAAAVVEHLTKEVGVGRVWAGVAHGNDPPRAKRVVELLRQAARVEYVYTLPISPSIYLHVGPGSVGAALFPAPDDLTPPPTLTAI